jgi:hypothetical protein
MLDVPRWLRLGVNLLNSRNLPPIEAGDTQHGHAQHLEQIHFSPKLRFMG